MLHTVKSLFVPFRCDNLKDCFEEIDFQSDFIVDLSKDCKYGYDLDVRDIFNQAKHNKKENILTYRDQCFYSKFTGSKSLAPKCTFMKAFDDSVAGFIS